MNATETATAGAWHIVRDGDNYYAETVRGTREDAERAAAEYRPNPWTPRGLAHIVPAGPEPRAAREYRAATETRRARQLADPLNAHHDVDGGTCCTFHAMNTRPSRERYADYLWRHTDELAAKGIDVRDASLSARLTGNDGE